MWLLNDAIVLLTLAFLLVLFLRRRYAGLAAGAAVAYACLPVVKTSETAGINPAYFVTALLLVLAVVVLARGEARFHRGHWWFLGFTAVSLLFFALGWLVNGNPQPSHLVHFAGVGQYAAGALCLSLLLPLGVGQGDTVRRILKRAAAVILGINGVFAVIQLSSFPLGYTMTSLLYTYGGKTAPLASMAKLGYFARAFGANYTPINLGILCLLIGGFLMGGAVLYRRWRWSDFTLFTAACLLGLFSFSKTIILGIFVLLAALLLLGIGQRLFRRGWRPEKTVRFAAWGGYALSVLVSFAAVGIVAGSIGLSGQVRYYFGFLIDPLAAFTSRYGGAIPSEEKPGDGRPMDSADSAEKEEGNMTDALDVVKKHPLIGVGPAAVENEFLGDSQVILVWHDGGVLAVLAYGAFYGFLLLCFIGRRETARMLLVLGLGIACLSVPALTYGCTMPFLAYCLAAPPETFEHPWRKENRRLFGPGESGGE